MKRALVCGITAAAWLTAAAYGTTIYVDDDAPDDPGPGDPTVSDLLEDGTAEHPFDAIQEGINAATGGDTVLVADGTYTGSGNKDLDYGGKAITVQSENGPETCVIDCQYYGRGFYFYSGETADSIVVGFTVRHGYRAVGGGVYCDGSSPTLINCVFNGNQAGDGGGMANWLSNPALINCAFSGNAADYDGGGLENWYSNPVLINCTFSGNVAGGCGGGLCNYESGPTLANCILWGNAASSGPQICSYGDVGPAVTYSCVQGGHEGDGNISTDPLFAGEPDDGGDGWGDDPDTPGLDEGANDDYGDFHLSPGSPCIDVGDSGAVPLEITADVDGDARVIHCHVDLGADESPYIGPDCNDNDASDGCDVTDGTSEDCNENGMPDECEGPLITGSSKHWTFLPCGVAD